MFFSEKKVFTKAYSSKSTNSNKASKQYLLDIILDKTRDSAYDSLTKEEKTLSKIIYPNCNISALGGLKGMQPSSSLTQAL